MGCFLPESLLLFICVLLAIFALTPFFSILYIFAVQNILRLIFQFHSANGLWRCDMTSVHVLLIDSFYLLLNSTKMCHRMVSPKRILFVYVVAYFVVLLFWMELFRVASRFECISIVFLLSFQLIALIRYSQLVKDVLCNHDALTPCYHIAWMYPASGHVSKKLIQIARGDRSLWIFAFVIDFNGLFARLWSKCVCVSPWIADICVRNLKGFK